jgi:hypothetical protein
MRTMSAQIDPPVGMDSVVRPFPSIAKEPPSEDSQATRKEPSSEDSQGTWTPEEPQFSINGYVRWAMAIFLFLCVSAVAAILVKGYLDAYAKKRDAKEIQLIGPMSRK